MNVVLCIFGNGGVAKNEIQVNKTKLKPVIFYVIDKELKSEEEYEESIRQLSSLLPIESGVKTDRKMQEDKKENNDDYPGYASGTNTRDDNQLRPLLTQ